MTIHANLVKISDPADYKQSVKAQFNQHRLGSASRGNEDLPDTEELNNWFQTVNAALTGKRRHGPDSPSNANIRGRLFGHHVRVRTAVKTQCTNMLKLYPTKPNDQKKEWLIEQLQEAPSTNSPMGRLPAIMDDLVCAHAATQINDLVDDISFGIKQTIRTREHCFQFFFKPSDDQINTAAESLRMLYPASVQDKPYILPSLIESLKKDTKWAPALRRAARLFTRSRPNVR